MKNHVKWEKQLIGFLSSRPRQIFKTKELSRQLKITSSYYANFKLLIKRLQEEGKISRYKGNKYGIYQKPDTVTGKLHVKTQGYGFLIRQDGAKDIFISQKNMGNAMHGDEVEVEIWAKTEGKLPEGRVLKIQKRGRTRVVGIFQEAATYCYIMPDDLKLVRDIYIDNSQRKNAKNGQKVVVEIDDWGDERRMPVGRVIEVLGYSDEKGVDVLSVAYDFDLPVSFPEPVLQEADNIVLDVSPSEVENRLDLRKKMIFTIDPEDAKDFDDGVSLVQLKDGNWELGVHIADVSHYVSMNGVLDKEAMKRATSTYLVDRVIPMLPEKLSNEICSLRPNEDRLTFSTILTLNENCDLLKYEIQPSVIHSNYRLSYQQAQVMIDGDESKQKELKCPRNKNLQKTLIDMYNLSQLLIKKWQQSGTIDFDAPEPKVVLDDSGKPVELGVRERLAAHRLVEAFMLLANRTVAEHIRNLRHETEKKLPFVYRVHEKPSGKKLEDFAHLVKALGYQFDLKKKMTPRRFQTLLEHFRETPHKVIVDEVGIRTMMKAQYSTSNEGHFGLAFKHYTHFTSPIRRYPDLIVHRLLKAYNTDNPQTPHFDTTLSTMCEITNEREVVAMKAERESIKAKQLEFMKEKLGEIYDGIVSGVVAFGIFVEIPEYLVEGLVHIKDLDDDFYEFDELHYRLIGQRTRHIYRLGDPVKVQVARVLMDMRKLDFVLADLDLAK